MRVYATQAFMRARPDINNLAESMVRMCDGDGAAWTRSPSLEKEMDGVLSMLHEAAYGQGHVEAMCQLAHLYDYGHGCPRDLERAKARAPKTRTRTRTSTCTCTCMDARAPTCTTRTHAHTPWPTPHLKTKLTVLFHITSFRTCITWLATPATPTPKRDMPNSQPNVHHLPPRTTIRPQGQLPRRGQRVPQGTYVF